VGVHVERERQGADDGLVSAIRVEPLSRSNAGAWGDLFVRAASPCFCRYWHFEGTKNDWLARCAAEPQENRAETERAIAADGDDLRGLVALEGDLAIGWMKITPRAVVPKLRRLPVYRSVELGDDAGVWSIGCFLVDPRARRRGVARALLEAAPAFVAERGGRILEAYPRHVHESTHGRLNDEEAMMGPEALFASCGFVAVNDARLTAAYPVFRRVLAA
jgi:GNAT superfamily N-acetyltransferase